MARPGTTGPSPLVQIAPKVTQRLTAAGYVFPVYGPSGFGDTFGAPRATTIWHHGQDIFAALGAPVLAVADGTLYSVGWNRVGGNRLWLRDRDGNEFYYAHLAAFSPLAVDGGRVRAGDVVGFVGNTGDADTTPYHLHFEIHPSSLLFLGYDGVVNAVPVPPRLAARGRRRLSVGGRMGSDAARDRPRAGRRRRPPAVDGHLGRQRARPGLAGARDRSDRRRPERRSRAAEVAT